MKILNKIISIILCIALLGCVSPVLAAETAAPAAGAEALGLINALEIAGYTSADLSAGITRGEFFKMAAIAGGYGKAPVTAGRFSDLSIDDEYAPYIESLVNANIISPTAMGKVYPGGTISLTEAASVMIKVLGYSVVADDKGGYPTGYKKMTTELELADGIEASGDAVLTKGMAVQLLYNALDTETLTNQSYGMTSGAMVKGRTLAETVFGVKHIRGVLDAVDISRLMGENDVEAFHIEIGGITLEARAVKDVYSYLGYDVNIFYKQRANEQFDKILVMEKTADNNETVIDIDDITAIDGQRVKYTDEKGRSKNASYKSGAPVIYNGVATGQKFNMAMIKDQLGKIRLLDNDDNGAADVVFVDIYKNVVTSYVDGAKYTMYNMYDKSDKIILDTTADNPYTIIYKANGEEGKITDINARTVVSVYQSAPDAYQGYIRAYISSVMISGTITKTRDNKRYITIDGKEYEVNSACIAQDGKLIDPGTYVNVQLDISGKAARISAGESTGFSYAYIMGAQKDGSFEKAVYLKLYTAGSFAELNLAPKVTLDGVRYDNTSDKILEVLHKASDEQFGGVPAASYSTVIRYMLNGSGEINVIDTILNGETGALNRREDKTEDNDALFVVKTSSSSDYYRRSYDILGATVALTTTANCIVYPAPDQDLMDEDLYMTGAANSILSHDQRYSASAFYTNPDSILCDFIGLPNTPELYSTVPESTGFAIVDYISEGLDSNGQTITKVGVNIGSVSELPVQEGLTFSGSAATADESIKAVMTAADLKKGDVIRYNTNKKGEISYINLIFRSASKTAVSAWTNGYRNVVAIRHGYVYDTFEGGYMVYFTSGDRAALENEDGTPKITSADCELVMTLKSSETYYKYSTGDDGKARVESAARGDLKPYKATGAADCSEIVIQQQYANPISVLIVE